MGFDPTPPEVRAAILALHAKGAHPPLLAAKFEVSVTTVRRLVNPEYRENQRKANNLSAKRRYARDPDYREKRRARVRACFLKRPRVPATPEQRKRWRLRAAAREEAAETGEPVERIYERWGVA